MTTDIWDQFAPTDDEIGRRIADDLRAMVRAFDARAPRSQQRDLGPSQIGMGCVRCLARISIGIPRTGRVHDDPWCRILGTATHTWLDAAAVYANGGVSASPVRWLSECRVHPHPELLPSGGRCDLYDTTTHTVLDHKVVGATPQRKYRAGGPSPQYRVQAHTYGLGLANAGYPVERVAIAFWLRGGRLSDLYVWSEAYDESVAHNALERYRTIRDQARAAGPSILPLLPADPDCWECGGDLAGAGMSVPAA